MTFPPRAFPASCSHVSPERHCLMREARLPAGRPLESRAISEVSAPVLPLGCASASPQPLLPGVTVLIQPLSAVPGLEQPLLATAFHSFLIPFSLLVRHLKTLPSRLGFFNSLFTSESFATFLAALSPSQPPSFLEPVCLPKLALFLAIVSLD